MASNFNKSDLKIRDTKRSDITHFKKLVSLAREEAEHDPNFGDYIYLKKLTSAQLSKRFSDRYKNYVDGNAVYAVAEYLGRPIGYCFIRKRDIPDSELSHVGIMNIRVAKEFRGNGIGTMLVKYGLDRSKKRFDIIELDFLSINDLARRLYRKFGFRRWGVAPGFVKRGKRYIDLEHMYLRLK